jgi:hypothetical protein
MSLALHPLFVASGVAEPLPLSVSPRQQKLSAFAQFSFKPSSPSLAALFDSQSLNAT